jgi:hypothetical protein
MDDFCGSEFWVRIEQFSFNFGIKNFKKKFIEFDVNMEHRRSRANQLLSTNSTGVRPVCIPLALLSARNLLHAMQHGPKYQSEFHQHFKINPHCLHYNPHDL